jgi:hypothetical protein
MAGRSERFFDRIHGSDFLCLCLIDFIYGLLSEVVKSKSGS